MQRELPAPNLKAAEVLVCCGKPQAPSPQRQVIPDDEREGNNMTQCHSNNCETSKHLINQRVVTPTALRKLEGYNVQPRYENEEPSTEKEDQNLKSQSQTVNDQEIRNREQYSDQVVNQRETENSGQAQNQLLQDKLKTENAELKEKAACATKIRNDQGMMAKPKQKDKYTTMKKLKQIDKYTMMEKPEQKDKYTMVAKSKQNDEHTKMKRLKQIDKHTMMEKPEQKDEHTMTEKPKYPCVDSYLRIGQLAWHIMTCMSKSKLKLEEKQENSFRRLLDRIVKKRHKMAHPYIKSISMTDFIDLIECVIDSEHLEAQTKKLVKDNREDLEKIIKIWLDNGRP